MPPTTRELLDSLPQTGRLSWIGLRPERRAPMIVVDQVQALAGRGLAGDQAAARARKQPGKRQVTLFQAEHLPVLQALLDRPVAPEQLRRNLLVAGLNLHALKGRRFTIGPVLLEHTGLCDPCSRMEEALGPGGFNAMRMHCGITARVLEGGSLSLGAPVRLVA